MHIVQLIYYIYGDANRFPMNGLTINHSTHLTHEINLQVNQSTKMHKLRQRKRKKDYYFVRV